MFNLGSLLGCLFNFVIMTFIGEMFAAVVGAISNESTNQTNQEISEDQIAAQQRENQLNRDWNTAEAEKARQFTTSEREEQQNYQRQMIIDTPGLQVQGMREAGINPNVALGKGTQVATGGASVPVGASGAQASGSMGLSPVPYQAQNLASNFATMAQGLSQLASAKEKGVNTKYIEQQIQLAELDKDTKRLANSGLSLDNSIKRIKLKYEDERLYQEIVKSIAEIMTIRNEGKLFAAQAQTQQSIQLLNKHLAEYHNQNAQLVQAKLGVFDKEFEAWCQLNAAQTKAANAAAVESYASAEYKKQLAKTENDLREGTIEMQSLHNDLLWIEKFIQGNKQKISDATFEAQLFATLEQCYREGLISENIYKEGQILSVKRDWAGRQEFANYMEKVVGAAAAATNSYANVKGVSVRRLNAKERNSIQDKFVEEFKQRGRFERENKIYSRESGDSWPMYMPYD